MSLAYLSFVLSDFFGVVVGFVLVGGFLLPDWIEGLGPELGAISLGSLGLVLSTYRLVVRLSQKNGPSKKDSHKDSD